jgi:hypothetical protein
LVRDPGEHGIKVVGDFLGESFRSSSNHEGERRARRIGMTIGILEALKLTEGNMAVVPKNVEDPLRLRIIHEGGLLSGLKGVDLIISSV